MTTIAIPRFYGDADQEAWERVLAALEDALDMGGVSAEHRGTLAAMHERAGLCIGIRPLVAPERLERAERITELLANLSGERWPGEFPPEVDGLDGVAQLHATGLAHAAWCTLSRHGGLHRIPDVEARTDQELLAIYGIGPLRVKSIRKAIHRFRNPEPPTVQQASRSPLGIHQLDISAPTWIKLCKMGLPLVAEVERADREGRLTPENGIGPRVLKGLRQVIESYHAERKTTMGRAAA